MSINHFTKLPNHTSGQTIGLFGGSFNPPHEGHLALSNHVIKKIELDQLWWMVSPGNPLKSKSDLAALEARCTKAKALANHRKIKITSFEADLSSPYTIDTVLYLKKHAPKAQFIWIMGADNLIQFHKWKHWEDLFYLLPILVVDRPGYHLKAIASKAAKHFAGNRLSNNKLRQIGLYRPPVWGYLSMPLNHSSSSQIRQKAKS